MNYLGHAIFSPKDDLITLGNLSGDFLKNRYHYQLNSSIIRGVYLHRSIDTFTDNHPSIRGLLPLFRPHFGKYSGVVLDVLLDYILCDLWKNLFSDPFDDFCGTIYDAIFRHSSYLPERPALVMHQMASSDWLAAYSQEDRLLRVFIRLSDKAKIELNGDLALEIVEKNKAELLTESFTFLKELRIFLDEKDLIRDKRLSWIN